MSLDKRYVYAYSTDEKRECTNSMITDSKRDQRGQTIICALEMRSETQSHINSNETTEHHWAYYLHNYFTHSSFVKWWWPLKWAPLICP